MRQNMSQSREKGPQTLKPQGKCFIGGNFSGLVLVDCQAGLQACNEGLPQ